MFAINTNYAKMIKITAQKLETYDKENIVLRVCYGGGCDLTQNNFQLKNSSNYETFGNICESGTYQYKETSTNLQMDKSREARIDTNDAFRDALLTKDNKDIYLNTGFTIVEFAGAKQEIRIHCVPCLEALIIYLNQIGAEPQMKAGSTWTGMEKTPIIDQFGSQKILSSMSFTSQYQHFEMTRKKAIEYLKNLSETHSPLEGKLMYPEYIRKGVEEKSRIFVISNLPTQTQTASTNVLALAVPLTAWTSPPCVRSSEVAESTRIVGNNASGKCYIPFLENHSTNPLTKQRLLFLFDCFKNWIQRQSEKWIEIDFSENENFMYTIGTSHNKKEQILTENKILFYPNYYNTNLWHWLNPKFQLDVKRRLAVIIGIMKDFGLSFDIKSITGPMEDYIDRQTFVFPVRSRTTNSTLKT